MEAIMHKKITIIALAIFLALILINIVSVYAYETNNSN